MTSAPASAQSALTLFNQASTALAARDFTTAAKLAQEAHAAYPEWPDPVSAQALALIYQNNEAAARKCIESFLEKNDVNFFKIFDYISLLQFTHAMYLCELLHDAAGLLTLANEYWPNTPEILISLGGVLNALGDFAAAAAARRRALHLQERPSSSLVFQLSAWPEAPRSADSDAHKTSRLSALEINPWTTPPEEIAAHADAHGVVVLKGVLSPDWVTKIHDKVKTVFLQRDQKASENTLDSKIAFDHNTVRAIELSDFCPAELHYFDCKASDIFMSPYLWRLVRLLMKRQPQQLLAAEARWSDPDGQFALPFHQDSHDATENRVNVWIPLQDCGDDAPGLAFIPQRLRHVEERHVTDNSIYAQMGFEIPAERIAAEYGDHLWRPQYCAGDVVIFHSLTIHATDIRPGMTKPRLSLEARYL